MKEKCNKNLVCYRWLAEYSLRSLATYNLTIHLRDFLAAGSLNNMAGGQREYSGDSKVTRCVPWWSLELLATPIHLFTEIN